MDTVYVTNSYKLIFNLGLPKFNIIRIDNWPRREDQDENLHNVNQIDFENEDVDVVNIEDNDEENNEPKNEETCVFVQIRQLKLLLRQCHFCGHTIANETLKYRIKGGVFFANFKCFKCERKRFWRSFEDPLTQLVTGATMVSGINISKILNFFMLLYCAFPSR